MYYEYPIEVLFETEQDINTFLSLDSPNWMLLAGMLKGKALPLNMSIQYEPVPLITVDLQFSHDLVDEWCRNLSEKFPGVIQTSYRWSDAKMLEWEITYKNGDLFSISCSEIDHPKERT